MYTVGDDATRPFIFLPNTFPKLPKTFNMLQTEKQNDNIHLQGGIS